MNTETAGANPAPTVRAEKFLCFALAGESYAMPVLSVREIIPIAEVTPVPRLPAYVEGVINLRGKIIPVVHLGVRFGFPRAAVSERTCIIVALIKSDSGPATQCGLIVEAVEEVLSIDSQDIEATPHFGTQVESGCIRGLANIGGKVKTLLDVERTLHPETVAELAA